MGLQQEIGDKRAKVRETFLFIIFFFLEIVCKINNELLFSIVALLKISLS